MSKHRIVLVGGGHSHALVLHEFITSPLMDAEVICINPGKTAPYSGMLPGFVAGHYTRGELDIDLARLCQKAGAHLIDARAVAMDPSLKQLTLDDGTHIAYDLLSFDVGITSRMNKLPGFADHVVPAKPLADFASKWDAFRLSEQPKTIAVIGGGIAGAELAMAMAFALRSQSALVKLVDRGQILSANNAVAQKRIKAALAANGIEVVENASVIAVTDTGVETESGKQIEANFIVGAAGATPHGWVADTGLELHNGFIVVPDTLQASAEGVFAVGDCAHMQSNPRPKAGVYAVRQAPVLAENLRRAISGDAMQTYTPQSDYLKLVSLGGKRAFGEKFNCSLAGALVWRLKDYIDRQFMKQFD